MSSRLYRSSGRDCLIRHRPIQLHADDIECFSEPGPLSRIGRTRELIGWELLALKIGADRLKSGIWESKIGCRRMILSGQAGQLVN